MNKKTASLNDQPSSPNPPSMHQHATRRRCRRQIVASHLTRFAQLERSTSSRGAINHVPLHRGEKEFALMSKKSVVNPMLSRRAAIVSDVAVDPEDRD